MIDFTKNAKVLIHVSRLLFPKYPSYYFCCYMCLEFTKMQLKRKHFKVVPRPSLFIKKLLQKFPLKGSVDVDNCAFIKGDKFSATFAKLYKIEDAKSKPRLVQIFTINKSEVNDAEVVISDTLDFNMRNVNTITGDVNIKFVKPSSAVLANEFVLLQVSVFHEIQAAFINTILRSYFATPKLLSVNDIIVIDIKEYAAESYYTNKKVHSVKTMYFKCKSVENSENGGSGDSFVCVAKHSALKLCSTTQSFIPKVTELVVENNSGGSQLYTVDICPYGLKSYFTTLKASIQPFLAKNSLKLNPLFLIQGSRGCGKKVILSSVARALGMHIYKISSVDVTATSYSQVEAKLRTLLFKIKLVSPCIFVVDHFENFGKNHEGLYDQRIIHNFHSEIKNLLSSNNFPVILVCVSNEKKIHSDLKRMFLKVLDIEVPTVLEREQILLWLLKRKGFTLNGNLNTIANKCHGFYYGDLEALVFHSLKMRYANGFDDGFIDEEYFFKALDLMQGNYSKSMGAPKVPKVEWSDIGGLDDVKAEIIKTVQLPLKHPEYFTISGLKRSGILLYGPPGTGKTLIAKAVATECNLCFLSVKGPELLNMYVGQSEENIRNVFQRAREAAPCIIFFDELDSLAPKRGVSGDSGGVMDRVVSQLLAEMDGLNTSATVVIIGATNRPDLLDPALLRPGRFDKLLYIGPCSTKESKVAVLRALTKKFRFASDVNLQEIVDLCPANITGADYYGLCSDAWMSAVRRLIQSNKNHDFEAEDVVVNKDDFLHSMNRLKPSVKPDDLKYFESLQSKFS